MIDASNPPTIGARAGLKRGPRACWLLLSALSALSIWHCAAPAWGKGRPQNPYSLVTRPTREPPQSIGSYNAGCIAGAVKLPRSGTGYRVTRPERRRFFGHPLLIQLVQSLGARVKEERLGVLAVGDLGQPRGGPTVSGHRSHQNGLDADLAIVPIGALGHGGDKGTTADQAGNDGHDDQPRKRALELAASFPQVERIFVHPTIKRALCQATPQAEWLRKIRPFWGHLDHFHVRLFCPADDKACEAQKPLGPGNGCGPELDWWFTDEAKQGPKPAAEAAAESLPKLPPACDALLMKKP